jgi:hypothetical protein
MGAGGIRGGALVIEFQQVFTPVAPGSENTH